MAVSETNNTQDHPVVAATRARQGRWGKHVLWVLIISFVLAAAAMLGSYLVQTPKLDEVQPRFSADTLSEVTAAGADNPNNAPRQNESTPLPVR